MLTIVNDFFLISEVLFKKLRFEIESANFTLLSFNLLWDGTAYTRTDLGLRLANERCRYKVTPSLIGWA